MMAALIIEGRGGRRTTPTEHDVEPADDTAGTCSPESGDEFADFIHEGAHG